MGGVFTRGVIENVARKQQINDFRDLRWGNTTPTDIDGVIEYHGKAYAVLEIKYADTEVKYGQRLCLERMIQDFGCRKQAVAAIIEHYVHDTGESVPIGQCKVREIYLSSECRWRPPVRDVTTQELLDSFFDFVDRKIAM